MLCLLRELLQMYVGICCGTQCKHGAPRQRGGVEGGDHYRRIEFGTTPPPHLTVGLEAFLEARNIYATNCICFRGTNNLGQIQLGVQ